MALSALVGLRPAGALRAAVAGRSVDATRARPSRLIDIGMKSAQANSISSGSAPRLRLLLYCVPTRSRPPSLAFPLATLAGSLPPSPPLPLSPPLQRLSRFSTARAEATKSSDVTEEPASIAHFTQSTTRHALSGVAATAAGSSAGAIGAGSGPSVASSASNVIGSSGTAATSASETPGEPVWQNPVPHPVYDLDAIAHIEKTHHEPSKLYERVALLAVKALRGGFDVVSGYRGPGGGMTERDWLHRCLFLETVAGVPGMVAGMARHLRSLRSLKRDYGWIHTLLEEAENERMHLLIFMNMKQPGWAFRLLVLGAQGVFFNAFFLAYLVSPRTCHRFVGYLEEEAVKTYTGLLQDIEDGHLEQWRTQTAPLIARSYYNLPESATVLDMVKCVRADEANHRDVNHTFAGLDQDKGVNPYMAKPHSLARK